jgi:cytoskeleton-associated protein 5
MSFQHSEAYTLEGDKIWSHVGILNPKDKSQLEERLKRVPGPDKVPDSPLAAPPKSAIGRLTIGGTRSISPAPLSASRLAKPMSPPRAASPALSQTSRTTSPSSGPVARLAGPGATGIGRPKSMLPSRLGPTRGRPASIVQRPIHVTTHAEYEEQPKQYETNGHSTAPSTSYPMESAEDVTLVISNILSNDPGRSVDALKKIQKVMEATPDNSRADPKYQDLAEHTEGLIETVTLQMSHVFEHPDDILDPANFRLAKHLIQTLNAFCDHPLFVQSLPVDIITSLLEELTLRLLVTDDSTDPKVKDLSKFINMILLRIFATGRRISIFRSVIIIVYILSNLTGMSPQSPVSSPASNCQTIPSEWYQCRITRSQSRRARP